MLAAGQSTYPLAGIVDARLPISLHLFTVFSVGYSLVGLSVGRSVKGIVEKHKKHAEC